MRESVAIVRSTLEELRTVFLGTASRHDATQNRWVIAETGYNQFLQGPRDSGWSVEKPIEHRDFTLRRPIPYRVTPEQQQQIRDQRPDAQFASLEGDDCVSYVAPMIESNFLLKGSLPARDAFIPLAHDAGFCLIKLLQHHDLVLKLPELVPFEAIGVVDSWTIDTLLPSDLTERWLAFLHILGWQNLGLSPLRAERAIWHENTSILGDPAEIQKALATPMLEKLRERITLPPRYFASTLKTDLNLASVYATDVLLNGLIDPPTIDVPAYAAALASLQPGNDDATKFHRLVQEILTVSFAPDLHSPISEEKYHEGRGRIDIVFRNAAERGYFADLPFRHNVLCPVVFFECKNYSNDVSGTEFAQLASRFSEKRSKVGFIVCRTIDDMDAIQKRCRDHFQDKHEHIVVLQDSDLLEVLNSRSAGDRAAISQYLHAKFRPIFMDR